MEVFTHPLVNHASVGFFHLATKTCQSAIGQICSLPDQFPMPREWPVYLEAVVLGGPCNRRQSSIPDCS